MHTAFLYLNFTIFVAAVTVFALSFTAFNLRQRYSLLRMVYVSAKIVTESSIEWN